MAFWSFLLNFFLFGYHVVFSLFASLLYTYEIVTGIVNIVLSICLGSKRSHQKRLVIIGGGFAGSLAAKKLQDYFCVSLIDSKDYFEYTPSVLRTIVEPNHINQIQILHQKYLDLKKTNVYTSLAADVTRTEVVLANGTKIPYDYLLICAGSTYNIPFKEMNVILATRGSTMSRSYRQVLQSEKILIIGGGLVGVELASEIIDHFPHKKVTMVDAGPHLMSRNNVSKKGVHHATRFLESRRVKVISNERIVKQIGNTFKTDKGTSIESDMAFLCTGITSNAGFLKNSILKEKLDERGFLKVNENLQVPGFSSIFAAGDICSIDEEKLAQNAEISAEVAVKNLVNYSRGKSLRVYQPAPKIKVISLGRLDGLAVYKDYAVTGFITSLMKEFVEFMIMVSYRYRAGMLIL